MAQAAADDRPGVVAAAGLRHGEAQTWANPGPAWKHRMPYGRAQFGRAGRAFARTDHVFEGLFDSLVRDHVHSPLAGAGWKNVDGPLRECKFRLSFSSVK
jgi:hypothetical protein